VGCQFCNRIRPALRPTGPGVVQICSACLVLLDSILSEHDVIQASAT
jgi:hypothetical protein